MLIEALATAAILLTRRDAPAFAAAALLAIIWASTAFLQVPIHNALTNGFDAQAHARLVDTNWIRTLAWTARGIFALYFLRATA
jgi:ABC-type microcin C transport system permease subunit YejB